MSLFKRSQPYLNSLSASELHHEHTFYQTFLQDLEKCKNEAIIESPYITRERMRTFDRIFRKLLKRKVKIYIITRDPKEHELGMQLQSEDAIQWCEAIGIQVLLCIGITTENWPSWTGKSFGKAV